MEKKFTDLRPEEVDYITVNTTSDGPYKEDVFFLIISKGNSWQVPGSRGKEFLDWIEKFPHINMEKFVESMGCANDQIFILYSGLNYPVLSTQRKAELKDRLLNFLKEQFNADEIVISKIADKIFSRYSENTRHYHNLEHIQNALWELDQLPNEGIDKLSIELAIWYHDIVYIPQ